MKVNLTDFLAKIQEIKALKPQYKLGHIGGDGYCDCIGLIMGALRRCGCTWVEATKTGAIHGSNWAARYSMDIPVPVTDEKQLELGDIVYKAKRPTESGYALPTRYREGKSCDEGTYLDYYHVGVVTSVNPLRITHCTAGGVKVDTSLGKWLYAGQLKVITGEETPIRPQPVARETVRYGSRGDGVKLAQELLNKAGAQLNVDGIFGSRTEKATKDFQRGLGLVVDGIIGPKTWAALEVITNDNG